MRCLLLLCFLSLSSLLHAQDEVLTLKVVKKNPIRESAPQPGSPTPMYIFETGAAVRINHSFSRHGWSGEAGVMVSCINLSYLPSIELQYSRVRGHFNLSGYEHDKPSEHEQVERPYSRMDFIKVPLVYTVGHWVGPNFSPYIETGIVPSYLLKIESSIGANDMNRFNCAYTFGGGIHLATNLRLGFRFSGDILPNLKDDRVYNSAGNVIGKQNSRKYLIGFSAAYRLGRHYAFIN